MAFRRPELRSLRRSGPGQVPKGLPQPFAVTPGRLARVAGGVPLMVSTLRIGRLAPWVKGRPRRRGRRGRPHRLLLNARPSMKSTAGVPAGIPSWGHESQNPRLPARGPCHYLISRYQWL